MLKPLLLLRPRHLIVALMVLVSAGCVATMDPKLNEIQTQNKTIAVASTLGYNLSLVWAGTTLSNMEKGVVAVPAWKVDEQAANAAYSALSSSNRYSEVTILTGFNRDRKRNGIPMVPANTHADFLLLIDELVVGNPDPMFQTPLYFHGLGIAQQSFLGFRPITRAHVGVKMELYDLINGKSLGSVGNFEHWLIDTRLKSGGKFSWKFNKYPKPKVDKSDLATLREPMTTHLLEIVDKLISEIGLR